MFIKPLHSVSLLVLTTFALHVLFVVIYNRRKLGVWWTVWGVLLVVIPLISSPLGQLRYAVANVPYILSLMMMFDRMPTRLKKPITLMLFVGFLVLASVWMLDLGITQ
jgi:hypothetical protein